MQSLHIHLIGAGKLGRTLAYRLSQQGVEYTLHGRNYPNILSGLIYCCVPEDAIALVASNLELDDDSILLHASGSLGLEALIPHTENIGCLHPIQSFPGPEISIPETIPATFQCPPEAYNRLNPKIEWLAKQLGFDLYHYEGSRLSYHTAAVIGGNFATILFHQAASLLVREGMTLEDACALLQPLALQSIANAHKGSLQEVLTGPIARQQHALLEQQAQHLAFQPLLQSLYQTMIKLGSQEG